VTRSHLYIRVKPGRRDELIRALDRLELLAAARQQPGFLGAEIQLSAEDENQLLLWSAWASPEHHERFLAGPDYEQMLRETKDLREDMPDVGVDRVVDAVQSSTQRRHPESMSPHHPCNRPASRYVEPRMPHEPRSRSVRSSRASLA